MFSMNNLEKTNLLFNKNLLQFYYIFKFQWIYIILIPYIIKLICEFKPINFNFLIVFPVVCIANVVRVTSLAARFVIYLLDTLAKFKGDREISRNTSSSPVSILSND